MDIQTKQKEEFFLLREFQVVQIIEWMESLHAESFLPRTIPQHFGEPCHPFVVALASKPWATIALGLFFFQFFFEGYIMILNLV